jgi:phage-related holin
MIYFYLISIVILTMGISLWTPGGIMLLDYIISDTPYIAWYRPLGNMFSHILGWVLGYEWGSKVSIFLILLAAGYLGILYANTIAKKLDLDTWWKRVFVQILGILFLIMNPYAYERMMTQPLIYAGVIALGYGLYCLILETRYIHAGIALGIALSFFPHASYMIVLILGLYGVFFLRNWRWLGGLSIVSLLVLLININWIIAPYLGTRNLDTIAEFSGENFAAFATQAIAPLDVYTTNILLYGFWGEQYDNHFAHVELMSPYWYVAGMLVFLIIIWGCVLLWQRSEKRHMGYIMILILLSLIFAIGQSSWLTLMITQWMVDSVPLWQWYREPQKWTWLIMIGESILFLTTVTYIYKRYIIDWVVGGAVFFALVMMLYAWSPWVLAWYRWQMRTSVYPTWYYTVREMLHDQSDLWGVLVLPWHAYIGCDWIQRPTIANPISSMYRGIPIIMPDTIEVGNTLYANNFKNPRRVGIDEFVRIGDPLYLDTENISHVILMRGCTGEEESEMVLSESLETGKLSPIYDDLDITLYRRVR